MFKNLILFILLLPLTCLGQLTISGKVLNAADKTPVANVSVFLSNTSTGNKTDVSGSFVLNNVKPGKYQLVVSIVGFETYNQAIIVNNSITLPDIEISPQAIVLSEVKVKAKHDPYRARNYDWFKNEFLGTSYIARECTILNPGILDLDYNDDTKVLTASSSDFLIIENAVLGYRVKYLLTNFTMNNTGDATRKVHYEGSVLFEDLQGSPGQARRWQGRRQEVYEGSEMHFLRSAFNNRISEDGFRVLRLASYTKPGSAKVLRQLVDSPLTKKDLVHTTDQYGIYSLGVGGDALHISYSKDHHFYKARLSNLNSVNNPDQTLLIFNKPQVLFDKNGGVLNPDDLSFNGAWGHNRVAELLPIDYEATKNDIIIPDVEELGSIAGKLKNFSARHIAEKVYLHFDKPYYAAGDTIYFKSYVTLGAEHRPSDLSGVLHVDLINTGNKIDQSIKLQLKDGVSWGDFALPDSLPEGHYRVRAYTQWMRNDGDVAYFEKSIPVGTINDNKIPENSPRNAVTTKAKPDLQFFPEGGQMITGITSKIAFKAVATDGLGADVRGVVIDEDNKEVTTFASVHNGMGYFDLTPMAGKTYKAKFTYADGTQLITDLPKADENGIALSINNDSIPKATVKIAATKSYYQLNKNKTFSLLIYSGGTANTVSIPLDSLIVTVDILKRRLHTGIATVTLFSPTNEPLCERLLFIQNYDQLIIALNSNKTAYNKREKTSMALAVKNRAGEKAEGHFSVSVVNESIVPADENTGHTILTDLLLTSDLKGNVEQPNYYFNNITTKTLADLDLVMLTNGYRRFKWKQVFADDNSPMAYQPEKGLEISGIAESVLGKPLANGTVSLIDKRNSTFISAITDNQGQFKFDNLDFTDTAKFILQAVNAKGNNNTRLVYNNETTSPNVIPVVINSANDALRQLSPYLESSRKKQKDEVNYGSIKGKMLQTVIIKDRRIENIPMSATRLVSPEFADQVIKPEDMAKGGLFSDRLEGALHGIKIIRGNGMIGAYAQIIGNPTPGFMLVVVDGVRTDGDLDELTGLEIEDVEVLKFFSSTSVYGKDGGAGVLVINTKSKLGIQAKDIASIGILPIYPKGYYKAREFYTPKYDHPNLTNNRPDLRSTIYWKPDVVTNADGNASFDYYNADTPGTYKITIEGIDNNGNLGVQVYRYTVE